MKPGQIPPHDPQAEVAVISCMMRDAASLASVLASGCTEEWFYDLRNQVLFQSCRDLSMAGVPVDMVTLPSHLEESVLTSIGGIIRLSEIEEAAPTTSNLPYWLDILRESWSLRRIATVCDSVIQEICDHIAYDPADALIDKIETDILRCRQSRPTKIPTSPEAVTAVLEDLEARYDGRVTGLTTGLRAVDSILRLNGLADGELVVLAARPSIGKTALALNMAASACKFLVEKHEIGEGVGKPYGGKRVLINSLEMSRNSIYERLMAHVGGVNTGNMRGFSQTDFVKLTQSAETVSKFPIVVDDDSLSMSDMVSRARKQHASGGVALWIVDYLGLVARGKSQAKITEAQFFGEVTKAVKRAAMEMKCPAILIAQMNREIERSDRKPRLSDLRSSGDIEQDADVVLFLHRPEDEEAAPQGGQRLDLIVAKQRNGPTGSNPVTFHRYCGSMQDPPIETQQPESKW